MPRLTTNRFCLGHDGRVSTFAESSPDIASLYGLGKTTGPLTLAAQGEQGVIWRIETTTGPYAVKELVLQQTDDEAAADIAFQERAAAAATSYDIAATIRTVDGRVLAGVADRLIRVQGWLDMQAPDPGIDPGLVGQMLAELHGCGEVRTDEVDDWYTAEVGNGRWHEYVDALQRVDADVAERLRSVVPELIAFEELITEPVDVRTCHRDLWADNVRMTPSGRLCVFDWDNCGPADVNHELAVVLWEYGLDDPTRIATLMNAYAAAGGPGRVTGSGDFTMLIAQFGHFYEMAAAPFLELTATESDRAHAIERFEEFESRPLTTESIGRILAVCSSPTAPRRRDGRR